MQIRVDDLEGPEVAALLTEHLEDMALHSPPESIHALDLDALRQPGVTFWTIWDGEELAGCGALKRLDANHGEIKSMRTARAHLRKGVASRVLAHILEDARRQGFSQVSLETGSMEAFAPARALYARFGFQYCEPFAGYVLDPHSVFMTLSLIQSQRHPTSA